MWAVCSSFASTTKSYTLEEECRTLVIVQAFFEHKNSYQVQIYLTHENTDNSLRPPEESFHSFCLSANFPLKMKAWKQNMLCLFDFLAASRRIGDCLMNRSLKNQSLFQSEILWWGLDTMTWAMWSKKLFWDQTKWKCYSHCEEWSRWRPRCGRDRRGNEGLHECSHAMVTSVKSHNKD